MHFYSLIGLLLLFLLPICLGQGFVIGPDWPPATLPLQFTSRVYRVSIVPAPSGSVTLTPSGNGLTFNPSSLNFDQNTLQQDFTFSGSSLGFTTISWTATAPYSRGSDVVNIVQRNVQVTRLVTTFPINKNVSLAELSIREPTTNGLTVTLSLPPTGVSWTVTPTTLDFSTSNRFVIFGQSSIPAFVQVNFQLTGADASLYTLTQPNLGFTANFRVVTVPPSVLLRVGEVVPVSVQLSEPPPTSLTITGNAPGVFFNPSTLTIAYPNTSGIFLLSTNVGSLFSSITWSVGGTDGGMYTLSSSTTPVSSQLGTVTVSLPGPFHIGVNQTMEIRLNLRVPPGTSLTITPTAANMLFNPPSVTFDGFCVQAEIVALPTAIGTTRIFYEVSGSAAPFYQLPGPSSVIVNPRTIGVSPLPNLVVGVPSSQITVTLQTFSGEIRGVPSPLTITPCVNPSSFATFNPPSFTITPPAVSGTFTITVNQVLPPTSVPTIRFEFSGPEASWFSFGSIAITILSKGSFITPTNYLNTYFDPAAPMFPIGIPSETFSITAVGVRNSVTLAPTCDLVSFNPPQLVFTASGPSTLSFTITGQTVGICSIGYVVTGPDADLFNVPVPSQPIRVINNFIMPTIPSLPVGLPSPALHFRVANTPSKPVWITPIATGVVFHPPTFILSDTITDVTFQILVTDLADVQASNPNIPGELYLNNLLVPPSAGSTTVTYIAQEMGETGIYPIPTRSPQSFTALPGYFNVSIPDLQLGVTSQMTITVKPPPRTNVVLTMYGNNLVFVPPSVTFLPGVDVVRVDVTPIIQSNAQWNIPFKVNYLVSGVNSRDYLAPPESLVSVHRRSDASTLCVPALLIASLVLVLLF